MGRYRIQESVGTTVQQVHSYEDLEVHHPSKHGHEPGRVYANIEGEREEVLGQRTSDNHLMVSKDFILTDSNTGSNRVRVPAPVSGYVGRVDEANGLVAIYDHKDGELIAQIRHMNLSGSGLREGQQVEYGQPLGIQSGYGGGNPHKYGTHVHVDFNERHLDQFKQYIRDVDTGVITTDRYPSVGRDQVQGHHVASAAPQHSDTSGGVLKRGGHGVEAQNLQKALERLGYNDAQGRPLKIDGDFGQNTECAVRAFQQAHGLPVDGVVGHDTREALRQAERTPLLSERTHPDYPLFREAREGVRQLPAGTFRNGMEENNAAAMLAQKAKDSGMSRIDHVLMNTRGDGVFAVQGNPQDPARHLVSVDKAQAAAQSVERSTELLAARDVNHLQSVQVHTQMQHQEHHNGLSMIMRP
jgi:X-Tfes, XVIPCD/Putative peptidoglycan binding domain